MPVLIVSANRTRFSLSHTHTLTFQSQDQRFPIFNQLFDEFVGFVQLQFMGLESLPELRAVQVAVTELQGRKTHLLFLFSTQDGPPGEKLQAGDKTDRRNKRRRQQEESDP